MVWVFVASWRAAETVASVLVVFIASAFREQEVSNGHYSSDRTHVEDLKNLFEAQPPVGDRFFVFLRMEMPKDRAPFIPLGKLLLNICYGPAIESITIDGSRYMLLAQLTLSTDLLQHARND